MQSLSVSRFLLFVLLGLAGNATPSTAAPAKKVLILGGINGNRAALTAALYAVSPLDSNLTILLPGNVLGRAKEGRYAVLDALAAGLQGTGAHAVLLPGAGEWAGGRRALGALADYLDALPGHPVSMPLQGGCPGPDRIDLGPRTTMILMDSEWWLQDEDRRPDIQSNCDTRMPRQILDELDDALSEAAGKTVLFATPLTLRSTGIRSGYFGPRQHLFPLTDLPGMRGAYLPLPVAGSLYPVARGLFTGHHDAAGRRYRSWEEAVSPLLAQHPSVIAIGGSEHLVQLYEEDGRYYVSSGATDRGGRATYTRHTPFTSANAGFSLLTVEESGAVTATFYTRSGTTGFNPVYARTLADGRPAPPLSTVAAPATDVTADSATAAVYPAYDAVSKTRRYLAGEGYRKEWATPVRLPLFRPGAEGFSFVETGGGNTTNAIRIRDDSGTLWSLRTIVKRFDKVLPPEFRATVAEDVLRDVGSAAYPWAGSLSASLSDAAGLPRPRVRYVYVDPSAASDTALGGYGPQFAGTVAMLEERDYGWRTGNTKGTWKVYDDAIDGKPAAIEARQFLRARLFDLLVADFDRHYAQWKWEARKDAEGRRTWWAVPKDRDQAFYQLNGAAARYALPGSMAYLRGFRPHLTNPEGLSFVARDIDVWALAELDSAEWAGEIKSLQASLGDEAIHDAVQALPPALYAIRGAQLDSTLRNRRNDLTAAGMDYYRFLAKQVTVTGTNQRDSFDLAPAAAGPVLTVWTQERDSDAPVCRYRRAFRAKTTDEIRLFGFDGDDIFKIQPGVHRGIRVRMVGGTGADQFSVTGPVRAWVYDASEKDNRIIASGSGTHDMISHQEAVNRYTFRGNDYNSVTLPTAALAYNEDDGLFIGLGASITRRGFRVEPFKSRYYLSATAAPGRSAYTVRGGLTINDAFRHYDLVVGGALFAPALQNFFGFGNETVYNQDRGIPYYRVQYNTLSLEALARKRLLDGRLSLAAGPAAFRYSADAGRAEDRVFENPEAVGLDRDRVFRSLTYGGGRVRVNFNSIDNTLLPVHGAVWSTTLEAMAGLDGAAKSITKLETRLDVFAPLSSNERFVVTLRGGGGHIFSDDFEYFQALTLGQATGLRGYRKARFAGNSSLWGGAEIRWRAARLRSKYLPADLGLLGFAESGRVWMKGEKSDVWHRDFGGGVFATPFNSVLLSAYIAVSPEESLFNASFGTGIGFTF